MSNLPFISKKITSLLIFALLLIPTSSTAFAQSLPACGQDQANGLADGDIDHYDLVCFSSIPDSYIYNASSTPLLFVDRSVGGNIDLALTCLGAGTPFNPNNSTCGTGHTSATYISHLKYNRANWKYAHYGDGGWWDNVSNFINNTGLREAVNGGLQPFTPNYDAYSVMNFQFSYLAVNNTNINGDSDPMNNIPDGQDGFFAPFPGDTTRVKDVHDMEAFESSRPNTRFFYSTTSLARTIGGSVSRTFNDNMRSYASDRNMPLIDFADIGSHSPQGQPCTDGNASPILCADYSSEDNGGHLSNAMSRQRPAMAIWLMMASLSGWDPNNSTPAPTLTPTSAITQSPTPTPSPVPSNTPPVPTSVPGDATGEGTVNLSDYNIIISNFGRSEPNLTRMQGDLDGNHVVDLQDFNQVISNFGYTI